MLILRICQICIYNSASILGKFGWYQSLWHILNTGVDPEDRNLVNIWLECGEPMFYRESFLQMKRTIPLILHSLNYSSLMNSLNLVHSPSKFSAIFCSNSCTYLIMYQQGCIINYEQFTLNNNLSSILK